MIKNKKGFTLVELLAVIAILAILMLLITPQILDLFQQGKEHAFVLQAQSVYKTATEKYLTGAFQNPTPTSFCHVAGASGDQSLGMTFDDTTSYKVEISNTGDITSIIVYDQTYIFEASNASGVKISEIKDNTVKEKKDSSTTITCSTEE